MMHGHEKSDSVIKPANKAERSAAELVEPRAETKGNAGWQSTLRTQSRASVSQALARMRSRMRESRTPLQARLVTSLGRPGGNLTGITLDAGIEIWGKRLQILGPVFS